MKWKKRRRRGKWTRDTGQFLEKNRQLLWLLLLLLGGALLGCGAFSLLSDEQCEAIAAMLTTSTAPLSLAEGCIAALSAAFSPLCVLICLFLLGLTAFGVPLILLMPLLFGFGIGITECYSFSMVGGILAVAKTVLPSAVIAAAAVLIASAEALRMSCLFSRQLLPASAHCGGMWQDFKLYLLRFLLSAVVVFGSAVADVLLRLF